MGKLHDFALKHDAFTKQINGRMIGIIDGNQDLLNLNRSQLRRRHLDLFDHNMGPEYSFRYAEYKGFKIPNLYLTGNMFKLMTIETNGKTFEIKSDADYWEDLNEKYPHSFGIPISRRPQAKQITTTELIKQYKKACYSK